MEDDEKRFFFQKGAEIEDEFGPEAWTCPCVRHCKHCGGQGQNARECYKEYQMANSASKALGSIIK